MNGPVSSLEDIILAGDHTSWNLEDWKWDHLNFTAAPVSAADASSASGCGSAKRLRTQGDSEAGPLACQAGDLDFWPAACPGDAGQAAALSYLVPSEPFSLPDVPRTLEALTSSGGGEHSSFPAINVITPSAGAPEEQTHPRRSSTTCQVEGCGRSLRSLTTYHQRCHICEVHIKMSNFLREGKQQRFCQRCGRCHETHAFDGDRRSCREQLAKHNARRRRRLGLVDEDASQLQPAAQASACHAPAFLSVSAPAVSTQQTQQPLQPVQACECPSFAPPAPPPGTDLRSPGGSAWVSSYASYPNALSALKSPPPAVDLALSGSSLQHVKFDPSSMEQVSSYDTALQLIEQPAPPSHTTEAAPYQPTTFVSRLSVKLFNCTPHELPADLRDQLTGWLQSTPAGAEGYIRSGCVQLTVDLLLTHAQQNEADMHQLAQHLMKSSDPFWANRAALLQLGEKLALVKGDKLLASWHLPVSSSSSPGSPPVLTDTHFQQPQYGLMPMVTAVQPNILVGGKGKEQLEVQLTGIGLRCEDCQVVCRSNGRHLTVTCEDHSVCCQSGTVDKGSEQTLKVQLPDDALPGLTWLEVQRGSLLSPARPVLITPNTDMAAEARRLLSLFAPDSEAQSSSQGADSVIVDLGLAIRVHACGLAASGLQPDLIAAICSRLLPHACNAGASSLIALLLDVALAAAGAVGACSAAASMLQAPPNTLSPMHRAVRSRSQAAVQALLNWGRDHDVKLQATQVGPQGLTPLHLAAVLGDGGAMARLLSSSVSCPSHAWFQALTQDGLSPHDFAARFGDSHNLDSWFRHHQQQEQHVDAAHTATNAVTMDSSAQCDTPSIPLPLFRSAPAQQGAFSDLQHSPPWTAPRSSLEACSRESTEHEHPASLSHESDCEAQQWDEEATVLLPTRVQRVNTTGCGWRAGSTLPWGSSWPMGQRPAVGVLAIVGCMCTCVVLLRGWTY